MQVLWKEVEASGKAEVVARGSDPKLIEKRLVRGSLLKKRYKAQTV